MWSLAQNDIYNITKCSLSGFIHMQLWTFYDKWISALQCWLAKNPLLKKKEKVVCRKSICRKSPKRTLWRGTLQPSLALCKVPALAALSVEQPEQTHTMNVCIGVSGCGVSRETKPASVLQTFIAVNRGSLNDWSDVSRGQHVVIAYPTYTWI